MSSPETLPPALAEVRAQREQDEIARRAGKAALYELHQTESGFIPTDVAREISAQTSHIKVESVDSGPFEIKVAQHN